MKTAPRTKRKRTWATVLQDKCVASHQQQPKQSTSLSRTMAALCLLSAVNIVVTTTRSSPASIALIFPPKRGLAYPKSIQQANAQFDARQRAVLQPWLTFENWKDERQDPWRHITAGLFAFAHSDTMAPIKWSALTGLEDWRSIQEHQTTYVQSVESYLETALQAQNKRVGTSADYDFELTFQLPILYLFLDRPDLVTNAMMYHLLTQSTDSVVFAGNDLSYLVHRSTKGGIDVAHSETENHVLMISAWRYLVNNLVRYMGTLPQTHDRFDQRIVELYEIDPDRYHNDDHFTDACLQFLGRVVHNGLFETNAKPYAAYSVAAILNFYTFADKVFSRDDNNQKIKVAAQNALDYLATEFAFQSLEGKRFVPFRRNIVNAKRVGCFQNDYVPYIFGTLAGAKLFEDFDNLQVGQATGFALTAAVLEYRLPNAIHDFILNKHDGYWARMQSLYTDQHYSSAIKVQGLNVFANGHPSDLTPRYFNSDGTAFREGTFKPVPQFYFATPDYINVAGGHYDTYLELPSFGHLAVDYVPDKVQKMIREKIRAMDVNSRPYTILTKGEAVCKWKSIQEMEEQATTMRGQYKEFAQSQNLATYKSFSFGYIKDDGHKDSVQQWPMSVPGSWESAKAQEFSIGRARFKIFDFRKTDRDHALHGYYVVLANIGNRDDYKYGFWEIIPGKRYKSSWNLAGKVRRNNPKAFYNIQSDSDGHYCYKLATSGERVKIHRGFGSSDGQDGFLSIEGSNLNDFHVDMKHPHRRLIDVWAVHPNTYEYVDGSPGFDGRLVSGAGNGSIVIRNPYLEKDKVVEVIIDSSDYKNPTNSRHVVRMGSKTRI